MRHRGWITAEAFIAENFETKIERGECEVWDDYPYSHVVKIENKPYPPTWNDKDWAYTMTVDKGDERTIGIQPDYVMSVDWFAKD